MRLRDEAKQQVPPRDFWTAITAAIVLLGIIGIYLVPLQHSAVVRWAWGALLFGVWGLHLRALFRFGWRAYAWDSGAMLLAVTLLLAQEAWPQTPPTGNWMSGTAMLLILMGELPSWLAWGRRPKDVSKTA